MKFFNYHKISAIVLILLFIGGFINSMADELPTILIDGVEYYFYEPSKGESLYGVAKKFGWDMDIISKYNPNATDNFNQGAKIYYPTGVSYNLNPDVFENEVESINYFEPIRHEVKKGETVYGISRQYNIPIEELYFLYPSTQSGVKIGEIIEIQQTPERVAKDFYYYKIKEEDSFNSITKKYNTSINQLLSDNKGLTEKNFKPGQTIRIKVNSNSSASAPYVPKVKLVEEEISINNDEITDSVYANVNNVNSGNTVSESNVWEQTESNLSETESAPKSEDSGILIGGNEPSGFIENESLTEIYDSIHGVSSSKINLEEVKVAVLLDDPNSKKDIDFTRGILIALKKLGKPWYKVSLKVLDGRVASNQIEQELDLFEPNIVFATADKAFPAFLADYGNTNNVEVVNVFDVRNTLYEDNSSIIQILPSATLFNESIAGRLFKDFNDRNVLIIGENDGSDGLVSEINSLFDEEMITSLTLADFMEFNPEPDIDYLVVSLASNKEEVSDLLNALDNFKQEGIDNDFQLVGRQNWILLQNNFNDKFKEYSVIIPSRVWLDQSDINWKEFLDLYKSLFKTSPVNSIPNFAATGFDMANYFIQNYVENGGDINRGFIVNPKNTLQTNFDIRRLNNWSGFINCAGYLLQFNHGGKVSKIILK